MNETLNNDSAEEEPSYEIDFLTPADAEGVVALYREVYGEHYPVKAVYDPAELINQEKTGDAHRLIARSRSGEVVGHISLHRSTPPNPELYEDGCLMVGHDFRQTDLSFTLFSGVITRLMPRYNIRYIWGEAVCNHLFTQQATNRDGFIETGLEMNLMPASSYAAPGAQSIGGRVSAIPVFYLSELLPRTVYTPSCYDEFIRFLYAQIEQACTFIPSDAPLPSGCTKGRMEVYAEAGIARITADSIGDDFYRWIESKTAQAGSQGAEVIQAFFRITTPSIGQVTQILQNNGYFIGGVLPCWFGDDGFFMQKIIGVPFFEGTHVYSKRAKKIKEYLQNDWSSRT